MKIILKNLKQVKYIVELESDKSTVKDLKNEIEKLHGFDSSQIKLLYNGKVLEDSKTIEEYQIKEESTIIMMNTKPKAKPSPPPSEQQKPASPKKEEQPKQEEQQKQEEQPKKEEEQPKKEEEPKPNYSQQINSLVDMGYDKEKVEKAINASKGNVDVAIEYLNSGNIPEVSNNNQTNPPNQPNQENQSSNNNRPNLPLELRRNASLMKIVCRNDPEKIFDILNTLEQKNPALLNKIREHQEEFKNLLVSPINQQDIDTYKLLEDDMKGLGRQGGRRPGQVQIRLTPEETEAVKRLQELGDFSQNEILTAYLACDKNEELAANYLFEQRWREEEEGGKEGDNVI